MCGHVRPCVDECSKAIAKQAQGFRTVPSTGVDVKPPPMPNLGLPFIAPLLTLRDRHDPGSGRNHPPAKCNRKRKLWRRVHMAALRPGLRRSELFKQGVALLQLDQHPRSCRSDTVVLPRGALTSRRLLRRFPTRSDQSLRLHSAQGRIHGAAGKPGGIHDVEPVAAPVVHGLQNHRGGMG